MNEYRSEEEKTIHLDFTEMMNKLSPMGRDLIERFGEMYPIGGVINVIGKFEFFSAHLPDEKPPAKEVLKFLRGAMQAGVSDRRFRATAVCVNVIAIDETQTGKTDALAMELNHSLNKTICFFLPYSKQNDGSISWGKTFVRK